MKNCSSKFTVVLISLIGVVVSAMPPMRQSKAIKELAPESPLG